MIFIVFKESICIQSFTFQNLILLSPSADDLQKVNWSNVWPAMSDQQCLTSNVWPAMSDQQCLTSNVWPAMSDQQCLISHHCPVSALFLRRKLSHNFSGSLHHISSSPLWKGVFEKCSLTQTFWKMFPHSGVYEKCFPRSGVYKFSSFFKIEY